MLGTTLHKIEEALGEIAEAVSKHSTLLLLTKTRTFPKITLNPDTNESIHYATVEQLNKILSGIRYEAQISTVLIIQPMQTTPGVDNVDSQVDEDQLLSDMLENGITKDQPQSSHPTYSPQSPLPLKHPDSYPLHITKETTRHSSITPNQSAVLRQLPSQPVTIQELCSSELLQEAQKMYRGLPSSDTKEES